MKGNNGTWHMSAWPEVTKQSMRSFFTRYRGLIIILFLAFLVRVIFMGLILKESGPEGFAPHINEDSQEYVSLAKNLAENGVFSRSPTAPFTPERARTPGYPLFLTLFYLISPRSIFLTFTQNVSFLLAIILLYHIVFALTANKRTALIASGLLAFEPATLYWNSQLTTESLFTLVILASLFCLILFLKQLKLRFIFYSGFFLGFTLLVRPIAQYLYIIFLGGLLVMGFGEKIKWKRILLGALLLFIGYGSITVPWMIRNRILFGTTSVSTMKVGFGKYISAMHDELGISINYTGAAWKELTEAERLAIVKADAAKTIARHPLLFAKIHLSGLLPFFLGDGYVTALGAVFPPFRDAHVVTNWSGSPSELLTFVFGHRGFEAIVFWTGKFIWLTLFIFWITGLISLLRKRGSKRYFAVFFALIIYYFALASGVGSYSRFRFPVNPLIFYFTAVGVMAFWVRAKKRFF